MTILVFHVLKMDRFTSSPFFPETIVNGKFNSGLLESIDSSLPVFSRDLKENQGAKSFFACGYEYFIQWYGEKLKKKIPQHIYEVLQFSLPTKLFFDFDGLNFDHEEFKYIVNDFLYHCALKLSEYFETDFDIENIAVLNASTPIKCSYHVIFQYFFKDMSTVKKIVEILVDSFDNEKIKQILDFSVYGRNRSFRLMYSSKKGKNNFLRINGDEKLEYNDIVMFDSLIQARLIPHYNGYLRNSKFESLHARVFEINNTLQRRVTTKVGTTVNKEELPPRLIEFIELVGGGNIISCKKTDDLLMCIISNMPCPYIKKKHKNNNQFFNYNLKTHVGWFKCADEECSQMIYRKDKLNWLICD